MRKRKRVCDQSGDRWPQFVGISRYSRSCFYLVQGVLGGGEPSHHHSVPDLIQCVLHAWGQIVALFLPGAMGYFSIEGMMI